MRKTTSGFTMVEILVVIAIIGILATITFMGFGRYQADTRDNSRAGKATIITEALEKYYDQNGEYPSCPNLTGSASTVTTSVLPGVEPQTLVTPQATSGTTNSIQCSDLTNISQPDFFAYVGDSSSTCLTGSACLTFQFKYKQESTGNIITINSRRKTNIAYTPAPTLSGSAVGFNQINMSWTATASTLSYDLVRATDNAFTSNVVTTNTSGISLSATGLAYNTTYYFRVRANSATGASGWSNTVIATTWNLSTSTLTATTNSSTSFTMSWTAVPHASSYILQLSSDGTTWSTGWQYSFGGTSNTFTGGVAQGYTYYGRVQAISGSYTGAWSNVANTTTSIDAPAPYSMDYGNTSDTWNYLNATSNAVCPSGTTPSYDWYANGSFWVSGTQYRSVSWQYSNWNQSVTLSVASRCITSATSSGFVWANNSGSGSLTWPTATTWLPGDRTMHWSGTCPTYTTSDNFYWRTQGAINASGNTWASEPQGVYYSNQSVAWGNGNAKVTLSCTGPWGTASVDTNSPYGSGCVPTITLAVCTQ